MRQCSDRRSQQYFTAICFLKIKKKKKITTEVHHYRVCLTFSFFAYHHENICIFDEIVFIETLKILYVFVAMMYTFGLMTFPQRYHNGCYGS